MFLDLNKNSRIIGWGKDNRLEMDKKDTEILDLETVYTTHYKLSQLLIEKRSRNNVAENELFLRKLFVNIKLYPYEIQLLIAKSFNTLYTTLELPKCAFDTYPKEIELEWMKGRLLKDASDLLDEKKPFIHAAIKQLITDDYWISDSLIKKLATSDFYVFQKFALLLIKRKLEYSYLNFDFTKQILSSLLQSKQDSIVLGALDQIKSLPHLFKTFPEKIFWQLSEKSETIQIQFIKAFQQWGNHLIFERILSGNSWANALKLETIKAISSFPSKKRVPLLITLLIKHPYEFGAACVHALEKYKNTGIELSKNQVKQIFTIAIAHPFLKINQIAFLIQEISKKEIRKLIEEKNDSISEINLPHFIKLLHKTNTKATNDILLLSYKTMSCAGRSIKSKQLKQEILTAFIQNGIDKAEEEIIQQFDNLPIKSMEALYYLGGKKTSKFLEKKLGFEKANYKKIDVQEWEEQAIRFLLERTSTQKSVKKNPTSILETITQWNVPYLRELNTTFYPTVEAAYFTSFAKEQLKKYSIDEINQLMDKLVLFSDIRGVKILTKLLTHENEEIQLKSYSAIKQLVTTLFERKTISPRHLLFYTETKAVKKYLTSLLLDEIQVCKDDFSKQEIVLNLLSTTVDAAILAKRQEILFQSDNIHFEKLVLEIIGNSKAEIFIPILAPYLNVSQDIFRLRKAIEAADSIGGSILTEQVQKLLTHFNMNIKKTAVNYLQKWGDENAVSDLIKILKYNNNSGLSAAVTIALKRILEDKFISYILNEIENAKTKRERELLTTSLDENDLEKVEWIAECANSKTLENQFLSVTTDPPKDRKDWLENFKATKITKAIKWIKETSFTKGQDQKDIKDLLDTNNAGELVLFLNEIRQKSNQNSENNSFLIRVLYNNGGILDSVNMHKAYGVANVKIRNIALIEIMHNKDNLRALQRSIGDLKINNTIVNYYFSVDQIAVSTWIEKEGLPTNINAILSNYEKWEFEKLLMDFPKLTQTNLLHLNNWISNSSDFRASFIRLIFKQNDKKAILKFIPELSMLDIEIQNKNISQFYTNLSENNRVKLIKNTTKNYKDELDIHFRKELIHDIETGIQTIEYPELTKKETNLLKNRFTVLLKSDAENLVKFAPEIERIYTVLQEDKPSTKLCIETLNNAGVFWEKEFGGIRTIIAGFGVISNWNWIENRIKDGQYEFLSLLKTHIPINKEILILLTKINEGDQIKVLNWLLSISKNELYFPQLFQKLIAINPTITTIDIIFPLLFKLCNNSSKNNAPTITLILSTLKNADEETQNKILDNLILLAPSQFLEKEKDRTEILNTAQSESIKQKAFIYILKNLNWHSDKDIQYLTTHLKKTPDKLGITQLDEIILSISTIAPAHQIAIYTQLVEIPIIKNAVQFALLELMAANYEIINRLTDNQKEELLLFAQQTIRANTIQDELVVRQLIKSMRNFANEDFVEMLKELLNTHRSSKIRSLCLREIKKQISKPAYIQLCNDLLSHKDIGILNQAIKTLAYAKKAEITPSLFPLIHANNAKKRKIAIDGILILDRLALPYLQKEQNKCRPDKRKNISDLIDRIKKTM